MKRNQIRPKVAEYRLVWMFGVMVTLTMGCQQQDQWSRIPLRGTVKLDGELFNGALSLRPEGEVSGPVAVTDVTAGFFSFDKISGPVSGPHMAILMPQKVTREQTSVETPIVVMSEPPFEIEIVAESPREEVRQLDEPPLPQATESDK